MVRYIGKLRNGKIIKVGLRKRSGNVMMKGTEARRDGERKIKSTKVTYKYGGRLLAGNS